MAWGSTQSLGKIAASSDHGHLGLISWQLCVATALTGALALGRGRPLRLTPRASLFAPVVAAVRILLPNATLAAALPLAWLLVALLGPFLYAVEANFVATWGTGGLDPVQAIFLASATALLVAGPLALLTGQWIDPTAPWRPPERAVTAASALTHVAYVWLAARTGAVFASQLSCVVTASGLLWASALLGERPSPWALLALVLLLGGVALVFPRPPRRPRP